MTVPSPPLRTQRAIASFLDREIAKIDTLVEKKEQLLALLEEKRIALISQAVTKGLDPTVPMKASGVEWLGEVPAHWEAIRLKHLTPSARPITYGIVQAGPHVPEGVPYIRTSDMSGAALPRDGYKRTSPAIDEEYRRSRVHPGDLVVAIRATVGKVLQVPDWLPNANLTQGTARVAPGERTLGPFLLLAIRSNPTQGRLASLAKGATFREITLGMLRELEVAVPPRDEQQSIIAWVDERADRLSATSSVVSRAITLLREYRSALISAAVTGHLDIPVDDQEVA